MRIPLIVHGPGNAKVGHVSRDFVSTLDLAATLLAIVGATAIKDLPGMSLEPILRGKSSVWRRYLFTEYHTHSANNFHPPRTVRNARYKLIQNLPLGQENPGYEFTMKRFFPDLATSNEEAPDHVRESYRRMKSPGEFELYDLQQDPYEFTDLVSNAAVLAELKQQLADWRLKTRNPFLDPAKLRRLKAEIDACMVNGRPRKSSLDLTYPDYFFATSTGKSQIFNLLEGLVAPAPFLRCQA